MTHDEIVEQAISGFDFEKVRKAMLAVGWMWHGDFVPTVDELKAEAERMIRRLLAEPERVRSTECGGLFVRRFHDGDYQCDGLELRFIMASNTVTMFPKAD